MKKHTIMLLLLTLCLHALAMDASAQQVKEKQITVQTSGHCSMCKKTIEKTLAFEKGVKAASFDAETGKVAVTFNPEKTDPDKIRTAITMVGYDADSLKADPKAYENLKPCCKKDGMDH